MMKYILMFLCCLMAAYPALDPNGRFPFFSWVSARFRKALAWTIAVLLAVAQCHVSYKEDQNADQREKEQKDNNEKLRTEVLLANDRLVSATGQVARMEKELEGAKEMLSMQQRSIGSLVYNIETSFEGKRRFANCFDALALVNDCEDYKSLICDDGVAVFSFAKEDDSLMAFHFYANSEINEVLSGMQIGVDLKIQNGRFVIARDSELALALERAIERKTPSYGADEISHILARKHLADQMRIFFRYVYRAENYHCGDLFSMNRAGAEGAWSGWDITFNYWVSPARQDSCRRIIELRLSESDVKGFCGLSKKAFTEKLLSYCRGRDVEPKVRIEDVDSMEKRIIRSEENRTFPYSREKVGRSLY